MTFLSSLPEVTMRRLLLALVFVGGLFAASTFAAEPLPRGAFRQLGAGPLRVAQGIQSVAFSPDGSFLAAHSGGRNYIYVWNTKTAERVLLTRLEGVIHQEFSADSKEFAVVGHREDRSTVWKRWKTADGSELPDRPLDGEPDQTRILALKGVHYRATKGGPRNELEIVETASKEVLFKLPAADQHQAVFSQDGSIGVIHASNDRLTNGGLQVWDMKERKRLHTFPDVHPTTMALSADGSCLVASNINGGPLQVWDLKAGKLVKTLAESFRARGTVLSPGGDHLIVPMPVPLNAPVKALLYDLSKEEPPREVDFGLYANNMSFSSDGQLLAIIQNNAVKLWDWKTGKYRFGDNQLPPGPINNLAVSRDLKHLATNSSALVTLWDVDKQAIEFTLQDLNNGLVRMSPNGEYLATSHPNQPARVTPRKNHEKPLGFPPDVSPLAVVATREDGNGIASGRRDGSIELAGFPGNGDRPRQKFMLLHGHLGPILALAYSPDGKHLISLGDDRTMRIWDTSTGKQLLKIEIGAEVGKLVALSTGAETAVWLEGGKLMVFDVARKRVLADLPDVVAVAFPPAAGGKLAICTNEYLALVDPKTGELTDRFNPLENQLRSVAFSPDGKRLYIGDIWAKLTIIDAKTLELIERVNIGRPVVGMRFSADGRRLLIDGERLFVVWDLEAGKKLSQITGGDFLAAAYSREGDNERVALLLRNGTRSTRDAKTGERIGGDWSTSDNRPSSDAIFTSSGELITTTSGGARAWNLETSENIDNLVDERYAGASAAITADDRLLALGGDGIALWDFPKRKLLRHFGGAAVSFPTAKPGSTITSLGFSPDGRRLASVSQEGSLRAFDTNTGRELFSTEPPAGARPSQRPFRAGAKQPLTFSPDGRLIMVTIGRTQNLATRGAPPSTEPFNQVVGFDVLSGEIAWRLPNAPETTRCGLLQGDTLITGDAEGKVLFWDFPAVLKAYFPAGTLTADEAWKELETTDARMAWQAVYSLVAAPDDSLARIQTWVDQKSEFTPEELADHLLALRSSNGAEQTIAMRKLARAGESLDPLLKEALAADLAPQARRLTLALQTGGVLPDEPDLWRWHRVVHVLEAIGPRSQPLLERLTSGKSYAYIQHEAVAALARLKSGFDKK